MPDESSEKRPHRVPTSRTRAFVGDDPLEVVNLSLGGARLEGPTRVSTGEVIDVLLRHPHLDHPASLRGRIVWSRPNGEVPAVGVKFVDLEKDQERRTLIRRCMLAEFGSAVLFKQQVVGYAVSPTPGVWGFYDTRVRKVADLSHVDNQLVLERDGKAAGVPAPEEAARQAFGLDATPSIDPAIEVAAPKPPSDVGPVEEEPLSGSKVSSGADLHGYVALTGQASWSLYDSERRPLGFMTHEEGSHWRIVIMRASRSEDDTLDILEAESYAEAIRVAFGLETMPQLTSAVFQPAAK